MPLCCQCNGSGRCINCNCAKSGKLCVDCLPSRRGGCRNLSPPPTSHGLALSDPIVDVVTNTVPQESLQENLDSVLTPRQSLQNEPLCSDLTENSVIVPSSLPPSPQSCEPCFAWGNCEGAMFQDAIVDVYKIVVHWRRNIFRVPSGKAVKLVVRELTLLFQAYAEASTLESVAITAAMVLPSLILQKPHPLSKVKEHIECIERRLKLWKEGNIKELVKERQTIQQHLKNTTHQRRSEENLARSFSKLKFEGKIRAALRLISK